MSVNPEFQTYSYVAPFAQLKAQSIVECRLTGVGEIASVLAVRGVAVLVGAEASNGEVRYNGKLLVGIIYQDNDKNVCRMERGAEFSHRAGDERIVPNCTVHVEFNVLSTNVRREGASLYVSCVVEAQIHLSGVRRLDYLTGGNNLITQKNPQTILKEEYCSGTLEVSDDFESDLIGDVLMHGESVYLQQVSASTGALTLSGEVAVNICVLKDRGLDNYERLLPFRVEIPCEEAGAGMPCRANVTVTAANVSVHSDEEGKKSKIAVDISLRALGCVYPSEEIVTVSDAFSLDNEVRLTCESCSYQYPQNILHFVERVNGVASISDGIDYSQTLQALVLHRVEAECFTREDGQELQGVVSAVLLVCGSDANHKSLTVQLPFALPFQGSLSGEKKVSAMVCGMSVRQKKEGEVEVDATLKFTVEEFAQGRVTYISALEEGEEIKRSNSAFSVFLPREGDGLWEIAKSLHQAPEDVLTGNPNMTFPVKKGERIIVYRQKL